MKSIKIILIFIVLSAIALLQAIISVGIWINKEDNNLIELTYPYLDESYNLQRGGQRSDRSLLPTNATLNNKENNNNNNRLDFAVIGFPRCGTTFLLEQLQEHKDVTMSKGDYCQIHNVTSGAERVSSWLQSASYDNANTKYGIKCSTMVRDMSGIENLMKISNNTRLVVGIRHPVKLFESFYNYRVLGTYNNNANDNVLESHIIPNPRELLDGTKHWKGVSTASARFDAYLKQLAKLPLDENERKTMLDETLWPKRISPNPYKVFMYTTEQLQDKNETRQVQFQTDLQHHLGLDSPFRDFNKASKANAAHNTQWYKEQIDICEPQYAQIRKKLVQQGRISSEWIINRFIQSDDVVVSDKDYFISTLRTWGNDPCQFPTNKEDDSAPRIAWLMSFPNSGTSYTKHLVDVVSGYNTASNYIETVMRSNDFIWEGLSDGPFYSASPSTYNDKNWTISPTGFVLTKTHCGSYCLWCKSEHYISSAAQFSRSCGRTDRGYYSKTLAKRAIHVIRDPFSNIVARFHLDYQAKLRQQNETNIIYTRDEKGFRKMCSELDSSEDIATSPFYRDIRHLVKAIPCSSDFFRYVQWHNLAHITTLNLDIPTLIIHYENYTHNFNQTVDKLHNFLQLDMKNPPPLFVMGKTYREYFTREERTAVKEMVEKLSTKKTWENVRHYFQ